MSKIPLYAPYTSGNPATLAAANAQQNSQHCITYQPTAHGTLPTYQCFPRSE